MPDVVVVKEVEQDAVAVVLPGLGRCFLLGTGSAVTTPARGRPACPSVPRRATLPLTCHVLSPWKKKKRAKPQTTEVPMMQSKGMSLMRSPLRSCGTGQGHRAGRSWQGCPSLPCPALPTGHAAPTWPGAGGLGSHLHDDVEGKVEEEVADADDQQVGSEVIGTDNEAVGSAGEAGTGSGVSAARGSPCPPCPCAPLSPRPARRSGSAWGHQGCRSDRGHVPCSAHSCHELAVLSPAEGTAAGGLGPQEWGGGGSREGELRAGRSGAGSGLCPAPHLQRPVDDVSHDQEHHSILQRARGAVRGGWGQRCQVGSPQSWGPRCREPRCQHSPRTWARCTAGRSPCTARAGSCAGCLSLQREERSCRGGPPCHPTPTLLTAVPPSHPASSAPCSRAGCSAAGWPRCG